MSELVQSMRLGQELLLYINMTMRMTAQHAESSIWESSSQSAASLVLGMGGGFQSPSAGIPAPPQPVSSLCKAGPQDALLRSGRTTRAASLKMRCFQATCIVTPSLILAACQELEADHSSSEEGMRGCRPPPSSRGGCLSSQPPSEASSWRGRHAELHPCCCRTG